MDKAAVVAAFLGLFAMMNPIGNAGIFISMTGGLSPGFKVRAALKTSIVVFIILEASIFGATAILEGFGISMSAFEVAGGIIVLGIGMKMLHGSDNPAHTTPTGTQTLGALKAEEKEVNEKLIVPLSMPILAGPGSITTVVTVAAVYPGEAGQIGVAVGTALLIFLMFVCFALSGVLGRFITHHAQEIILRFMGMLLVAIAVGMVFDGTGKSIAQYVQQQGPSIVESINAVVDEHEEHETDKPKP